MSAVIDTAIGLAEYQQDRLAQAQRAIETFMVHQHGVSNPRIPPREAAELALKVSVKYELSPKCHTWLSDWCVRSYGWDSPPRYSHLYTVAFEVVSTDANGDNIPFRNLVRSAYSRLAKLEHEHEHGSGMDHGRDAFRHEYTDKLKA